jgi:hypothetical protein
LAAQLVTEALGAETAYAYLCGPVPRIFPRVSVPMPGLTAFWRVPEPPGIEMPPNTRLISKKSSEPMLFLLRTPCANAMCFVSCRTLDLATFHAAIWH